MISTPVATDDGVASMPPIACGSACSTRATWSGLLRLSLVTVPVKAYTAVSSTEGIQLNQLHRDCGQRVRYEKHCPVHGKLDSTDIVKGHQYAPDQYVLVETDELDKLRPPQEKALSLVNFILPDQIDPMMFAGKSYYLAADGLPAQRPYQVLHQAMRQRACWAVGWVTMAGSRRPIIVRPGPQLLAMHVLHFPARLRMAPAVVDPARQGTCNEGELELAETLIESFTAPVNWSEVRDDTTEKLAALVDAKVAGHEITAPAEEPAQLLSLVEALKKSVATSKRKTARQRKSTTTRPTTKKTRRRSA